MRQIVTISVGGFGTRTGDQFWKVLGHQHNISPNFGKKTAETSYSDRKSETTFYEEISRDDGTERFTPRAIFIDIDHLALNQVRSGTNHTLYLDKSFVSSNCSPNNTFSQGFYGVGKDLLPEIKDAVRTTAERCSCLNGFQFIHSLSGGTGSGLTSLVVRTLSENYNKISIIADALAPDKQAGSMVTETYNTCLVTKAFIQERFPLTFYDNVALENIAKMHFENFEPTYGDLNLLVAWALSDRCVGERLTEDSANKFQNLGLKLIPFPRFCFLLTGMAPLGIHSPWMETGNKNALLKYVYDVFLPPGMFSSIMPLDGKIIAVNYMFQGERFPMSHIHIENVLNKLYTEQKEAGIFVSWMPKHMHYSLYPGKPLVFGDFYTEERCLSICNSTSVCRHFFKPTIRGFETLFKVGAFLGGFLSDGMTQEEMKEAQTSAQLLVKDYEDSEKENYHGPIDRNE